MQSLKGLGLPSVINMDEFDTQVARPRAQPSPSGGGGASAAQEPKPEEPATAEGRMSSLLLSPFILMQVYTWLKKRRLLQTRFQSYLQHPYPMMPYHLHQHLSQSSLSLRIHQLLKCWISMSMHRSNHKSKTFKLLHFEQFSLF